MRWASSGSRKRFQVIASSMREIAAGLGGGSPRNVPAAVAPEIKIPQAGQALYVYALDDQK